MPSIRVLNDADCDCDRIAPTKVEALRANQRRVTKIQSQSDHTATSRDTRGLVNRGLSQQEQHIVKAPPEFLFVIPVNLDITRAETAPLWGNLQNIMCAQTVASRAPRIFSRASADTAVPALHAATFEPHGTASKRSLNCSSGIAHLAAMQSRYRLPSDAHVSAINYRWSAQAGHQCHICYDIPADL